MFRLANTVEFRISKLQLRMRFAKNILHLSYLLHFIIFVFGVVCVYWNHPQLYLFICCAFAAFALKFIAKSVRFFLFIFLFAQQHCNQFWRRVWATETARFFLTAVSEQHVAHLHVAVVAAVVACISLDKQIWLKFASASGTCIERNREINTRQENMHVLVTARFPF